MPEGVVLVLATAADTETLGLAKAGLSFADVRIARDAPDTFLIADTERPELIVARLETVLDGWELVKQLKRARRTAHIPVLGIADRSYPELEERAIAAGFDAVLLLPLTATTLGEVGRLLITRARLLRERSVHPLNTGTATLPRETSAVPEFGPAETTSVAIGARITSLRCRRCGNDADSRLVRTTATSVTYRCGRCNAQWRRTHTNL